MKSNNPCRWARAELRAVAAALITVFLWASAFPLIRVALRSFEPIPLASLRFAVAAIPMLVWLVWRRAPLPSARDLSRMLACAAIGIALYNVLLNSGQRSVSAGAASFLVNTAPVITALLASVFLGERFGSWAWAGTAISFTGIALIACEQAGGLFFGVGAFLVLGAAVCMATFFTLQRPLVSKYGATVCTALVVVLGAILLAPWLHTALNQAASAPASAILAVVYLGVFPAAVGYATWAVAQAHLGAGRAANFLYLVPIVATVLAYVLTSEMPSTVTLIGGAVAIAGVFIVNTRGRS